jgi:hypothetical protein
MNIWSFHVAAAWSDLAQGGEEVSMPTSISWVGVWINSTSFQSPLVEILDSHAVDIVFVDRTELLEESAILRPKFR